MKPATPLPWRVGEYDDCLGYDCMTGGRRAGPVVLDASDYGQRPCTEPSKETLDQLDADAAYIVHACNAYPKLVAALNLAYATLTDKYAKEEIGALLRELGELS